MAVVHIPEPCPMKLGEMTPVHGGFHCASCSKVVIDFREKSNEEILNVIQSAGGQRTCGIFINGQAMRGPKPTFELVRFAAAVILVFGSVLFTSCEDQATIGKLCDPNSLTDSALAADSMLQTKVDSFYKADSVAAADTVHMIGFTEPDTIGNIAR